MGPEIKEVAEKKAKEINEAYEHLRKSLNLS
jgi:DnaJ-class molecular chaperone